MEEPRTSMRPLVGRRSPLIVRKSVDFPDPLGPSRRTSSPLWQTNETSSRTQQSLMRTLTSVSLIVIRSAIRPDLDLAGFRHRRRRLGTEPSFVDFGVLAGLGDPL